MNQLALDKYNDIRNYYKTNKIDIDTFIINHKERNWCEAIIFPNGYIAYAKPSHVETLLREAMEESNMNVNEIYDIMPIYASPLNWLIDFTKCICIYYEGYLLPINSDINVEQQVSLRKLKKAGLTGNKWTFKY